MNISRRSPSICIPRPTAQKVDEKPMEYGMAEVTTTAGEFVQQVISDDPSPSEQANTGEELMAEAIGTLNVTKDCNDNEWFGRASATDIAILGQLSSIQNQQAGSSKDLAVQNGDLKYTVASQVRDSQAAVSKEVNDSFKDLVKYHYEHQMSVQKEFCETRELVREKFEATEIRRLQDKLEMKELLNTEYRLKISQMEQTNSILAALRAAGINVPPAT